MMTDRELFSQIQRMLIEPPNGGIYWASDLWTQDEVLGYLTRRQDAFQRLTHLQVGLARIDETATVGTYDLPDDWMATVLVIRIESGMSRELPLRSTFDVDHHEGNFLTPDIPQYCEDQEGGTRTLRLFPAPATAGTLLVVYVPSCPPPSGTGDPLTLPDELIDAGVKWGVLADMLLKVARPQDVGRADYCLERWQLAVGAVDLILKGWA